MKPLLFLGALSACALLAGTAQAAAPPEIRLEPAVKTGGLPLNEALAARHSDRNIKADELAPAQLSGILWSAFGVNRDGGKRTIPTSHGKNELAVYAVLKDGVYAYDAEQHKLTLALEGDFLGEYGKSPLIILYAAPDSVMGGLHAGSAYQNVGLYCASAGLANVVKTSGADALKGKLTLPEGYQVLAVQHIGLPG
jgi:hypothetical protein